MYYSKNNIIISRTGKQVFVLFVHKEWRERVALVCRWNVDQLLIFRHESLVAFLWKLTLVAWYDVLYLPSNITVSSWCFYLDNSSEFFCFERSQVKSDLDISSDLKSRTEIINLLTYVLIDWGLWWALFLFIQVAYRLKWDE